MTSVPFLLLIEDDDAIRTALELSLSRQGHQVATAATGEDGLQLLREQRPDLIVLDVMLPGIDGFEVCRRIRRTDQLPIILLTARNDDIDVVVGLESGADDYVVKPVQGGCSTPVSAPCCAAVSASPPTPPPSGAWSSTVRR